MICAQARWDTEGKIQKYVPEMMTILGNPKLELHAVMIPNIMYYSVEALPITCCGLEKCQVVAFSSKGHIRYAAERNLTRAAVKYVVDHLPLKTIIVYSACGNDESCLELFQYAIDCGIRIIIPDNSLRNRNIERRMQNERK